MKKSLLVLAITCSQLLLCGCHFNGRGGSSPSTPGDNSIPPEVEERGEILMAKHHYNAALRLMRPYALKGNSDAQFGMAFILAQRDGEKADAPELLDWMRKAAAQGHQQALQHLSDAYRWGWWSLPTNLDMSAMWLNAVTNTNEIQECFRFERALFPTNK